MSGWQVATAKGHSEGGCAITQVGQIVNMFIPYLLFDRILYIADSPRSSK